METVAAIDCGTNTIKLLVADVEPTIDGPSLVERVRTMRMIRLGEGVDATGRLGDAALGRLFAALDEHAVIIEEHRVDRLRFCATSAARDAENAADFIAGVIERLGVEPEVLSGDEEARLSYSGATRQFPNAATPYLVIDIGGGSTELVLGADGQIQAARSLDIGSVRLTERIMRSDPPTDAEIAETTALVDAALDDCGVPIDRAGTVVGVAGTITTTAAATLGLPEYDRSRINGAIVPVRAIHEQVLRFLLSSVDERRALPVMHPGRADVIGAGALILDRILARTGADTLTVSESDILDGIAWSLIV